MPKGPSLCEVKINIPSPPGLLEVQMFLPLEREKRKTQVLPEQMGAKAVINPQQSGCLIFCQRFCSRLWGEGEADVGFCYKFVFDGPLRPWNALWKGR